MNALPVLLAFVSLGPIYSDPCAVAWQVCPIPWSLPAMPYVPTVDPVEIVLPEPDEDEFSITLLGAPDLDIPVDLFPDAEDMDIPTFPPPEHGEDYEQQEIDFTDQVNLWMAPVQAIQAVMANWFGETGAMPDSEGGDFDPGIDPAGDSAFDFAAGIGTNIAVMFDYTRALSGLTSYSIGTLIVFMIGCAAWLALMRFIIFALAILDMLWSILVQGVQALGEAAPWPW